ncbi:hypothetical protein K458DRAFT_86855 [Lentithecium fluviatile CBS 122367]|uniref:Uncharacterized protein n=1 Tax=Lentithecium fluviatile CBS 122367 TaxID=1168545 RepID=A0A6G1ISR8_9PLEO|nr:hypothetical protein K458DRAFT_86855 [Lentithecium fluviatile CBS 122367]
MANSRSTSHARLHKHKRGTSASSIGSPRPLSPVADSDAFTFNRSETPKVTYEEPWVAEPTRPKPTAASSHKIKPYMRKLSLKDQSLDLSRPSENDQLAGLGISEYGVDHSRSASDVNFISVNARSNRHGRSTSNTSQFSTSSSLQRPTAPYTIRPSARPYTPPISKSTPSSVLGSEVGADDIMSDEEYRLRQHAFDPSRRSGSLSSTPGAAPALRIHTTGSSTRLAGSYSQSTVSLTSPIGQSRSRGDTLRSMDTTTSPSSRTSFDKAFGFVRGGRDSPVDAASRAASIRAAREAFQEKEAAKERKYDMEAYKRAEKQYKKTEQQQRKAESTQEKKRARSISDSNEKASRPSIGGRQYSDHRHAHTSTLPKPVATVHYEKRGGAGPKVTKSREAKGTWLRFVTWFKTRLLRISRRMNCAS